ncbi:MAG: HRDC domain-containing protein [Blastocatellia bacterium]
MLTRIITVRFNSLLDGFDDAPLRDFIKDKEVISARDHFFIHQEKPYLAMVVHYALKPIVAEAVAAKPKPGRKQRDETWREYVAEDDVPLFNALRDWRLARSKRDGLPPYVIRTNRMLGAMIVARPQSLAALGEIEGFGKAKLENYGAELLAILARSQAEDPANTAPPESVVEVDTQNA